MGNDNHPLSQVTVERVIPTQSASGSTRSETRNERDENHEIIRSVNEEFKLPPKPSAAIIVISNILLQVSEFQSRNTSLADWVQWDYARYRSSSSYLRLAYTPKNLAEMRRSPVWSLVFLPFLQG